MSRASAPAPLRRSLMVMLAVALLVPLTAAPASSNAVTETSDTLSVVEEGAQLSNVEVAVQLSSATPLEPDRVLVGRDDVFVDSMTSGVLQGASPLLLVPPEGPVPEVVMDELTRLDPDRVTLLGGEAAIRPAVADELTQAGYAVDRKAGQSRFETAVDIARDGPPSTTAILARAFAAEGASDPTQAFADSMAAGGMAAENGWPILLTQSDVLSGPTKDHMQAMGYERVLIMGGTAAVGAQVEAEVAELAQSVERISGPNRFGTGIAVAEELGASSAEDVDRVTLVDGQGPDSWAGGFAAAAHSAHFDAPIVLGTGDTLPGETADWLDGADGAGAFAGADSAIRLTCVIDAAVCETGRQELGLPPAVAVTFTPPSGATVQPGATVTVDTGGAAATVAGGTCVDGATGPLPADGTISLRDDALPGSTCEVVVTLDLGQGVTQTETARYLFGQPAFIGATLVSADPDGNAVGGRLPDIADEGAAIVFVSDGDVLGAGINDRHIYAVTDGPQLVDVRPDGSVGEPSQLLGSGTRPRVSASGQHVVFVSADANLDSEGASGGRAGSVYLRDLQAGVTRLVSRDAGGDPLSNVAMPAVSADGRVVAHVGDGVGPTGADSRQIFIHDLAEGTVEVVRDHTGSPFLNADVASLDLSADGDTVVFGTSRPDLIAEDRNARPDVYAYTVGQQTVERVSVSDAEEESEGETATSDPFVSTSADGNLVAFTSGATNLAGAGGTGDDVFLRDRVEGRTVLGSRADAAGAHLDGASRPNLSGNGEFLTFVSERSPDGSQAPADGCGIYRVRAGGPAVRMDVDADGAVGDGFCGLESAAVTNNGLVVFSSTTALQPQDTNGNAIDVYAGLAVGG